MVHYLTDDIERGSNTPVGFATGLDISRNINTQWQVKIGLRYCWWKVPDLFWPAQWPSEHDGNGGFQYDHSLWHYQIIGFDQASAFQFLPALRWQSKPEEFHWFILGEFGFSGFLKNDAGISTRWHPTAGLAFGGELLIVSNLHLFAQPGARIVLRDFKGETVTESHLLNLQVEIGGRYSF